jgi:hypothetical protein
MLFSTTYAQSMITAQEAGGEFGHGDPLQA